MGNQKNILTDTIAEFKRCQDFEELEGLADRLGNSGDLCSIEVLISRLSDEHIQQDDDVEDAVCGSLVKLGVMKKIGNLNFRFLDETSLPVDALSTLNKYRPYIPKKYF